MKIKKLEHSVPTKFSEGIIFSAIEKYIDTVNFPKNTVYKKLDLSEKLLLNSANETESLINKGSSAINALMDKSQKLSSKCNALLRDLRQSFSSI